MAVWVSDEPLGPGVSCTFHMSHSKPAMKLGIYVCCSLQVPCPQWRGLQLLLFAFEHLALNLQFEEGNGILLLVCSIFCNMTWMLHIQLTKGIKEKSHLMGHLLVAYEASLRGEMVLF